MKCVIDLLHRPAWLCLLAATAACAAARTTHAVPPSNDQCVNAVVVSSLPFTDNPLISEATNDGLAAFIDDFNPSCVNYLYSVWYQYTPASTQVVRVDTTDQQYAQAPNVDWLGGLASGTICGNAGLTSLQCLHRGTIMGLNAGTTYYMLFGRGDGVDTDGNPSNDRYDIRLTTIPRESNDDCGSATTMTAGTAAAGSTLGTTDGDVWYRFTAPSYGQYVIGAVGSGASPLSSPRIDLRTSCSAFWWQRIAANVENGANGAVDSDPNIYIVLNAGESVYIRVFGAGFEVLAASGAPEERGTFTLSVSAVHPAQPTATSDTCATATSISSTFSDSKTFNASSGTVVAPPGNEAQDNEYPAGCAFAVKGGLWYKYIPPSHMQANLTFTLSTPHTGTWAPGVRLIQVFSGSCGAAGLSYVACSESGFTDTANVSFEAFPGSVYYILIGASDDGRLSVMPGDTTYSFSLSTQAYPPAPSNDDCAGATPITSLPFEDNPSIGGAADENFLYPCHTLPGYDCPGDLENGVWYTYTPPSDQVLKILRNTTSPNILWNLSIFTGTCSGLLPYQAVTMSSSSSGRSIPVRGGTPYFFRIASGTTPDILASYFFRVELSASVAPPFPSNDNCATASPITLPFVSGQVPIAGAADSLPTIAGSPDCVSNARDIWYSYTSGPASEILLFTWPEDQSVETGIGLFTGSCGSLTPAGCVDAYSGNSATFTTQPNTTYFLRVAWTQFVTFVDLSMFYNFEISTLGPAPSPPVNDHCAQASNINQVPFTATVPIASADGDEVLDCYSSSGVAIRPHGIWYTLTTVGDQTLTFTRACNGGIQQCCVLSIYYDGPCGELEPIDCEPLADGGQAFLSGGTRYYLLVNGENAAVQTPSDSFTFTISTTGGVVSACPANFNGVNGVTVQDIFDFLTAWLAGSPSANFNGVNGVTVQDIFDFLTAWLAGC